MPKHSRRMKGCGKQMKGGNGAAEYGQSVYGGMGQQHAGPDGSIAVNGSSTPMVPGPAGPAGAAGPAGPAQKGGRRKKKNQSGGKTILGDLAVPAGLLYLQQRATKKRGGKSKKQQSRKSRGSRRNR